VDITPRERTLSNKPVISDKPPKIMHIYLALLHTFQLTSDNSAFVFKIPGSQALGDDASKNLKTPKLSAVSPKRSSTPNFQKICKYSYTTTAMRVLLKNGLSFPVGCSATIKPRSNSMHPSSLPVDLWRITAPMESARNLEMHRFRIATKLWFSEVSEDTCFLP
jgi:hypothetical protein